MNQSNTLLASINAWWRGSSRPGVGNIACLLITVVAVLAFLQWATRYLQSSIAASADLSLLEAAAICLLIALTLLLVAWQLIGAHRTIGKQMAGYTGAVERPLVYLVLIGYLAMVLFGVMDLYTLLTHKPDITKESSWLESQVATLDIDSSAGTLVISGHIGFGSTSRLRELLSAYSDHSQTHQGIFTGALQSVVLDSPGGVVYEARGIAQLLLQQQVRTHVENQCLSTCTLIFSAGATRTLGPDGVLGYHGYRLDTEFNSPWVDVEAEQARDLQFMQERGIARQFLDKVFAVSPDSLWLPDGETLRRANVITQ